MEQGFSFFFSLLFIHDGIFVILITVINTMVILLHRNRLVEVKVTFVLLRFCN